MKMLVFFFAMLAGLGLGSVQAQSDALADRRTTIDPSVVPIAFTEMPIVRPTVGRNEPFLEGNLAYGYGGRLSSDLRAGKQIIVPVGSPAYAVPMLSNTGRNELVWCAFPTPIKRRAPNVCLTHSTLAGESNDSLMITGLYVPKYGSRFTGGSIVPARFDLGAPIRVAYYIQNLGKITRIKAIIKVGDVEFNQWVIQWGDIARPKSTDGKLIAVAGGVLGISPDPKAKTQYIVKIIAPLAIGESAILAEIRNDVRR